MKDAMLESPYCDDTDAENCTKNCCANTVIAPLYFITFCLVSTFVMLNLVIAVLMAELENAENDPDLMADFEGEEMPDEKDSTKLMIAPAIPHDETKEDICIKSEVTPLAPDGVPEESPHS
jgi:hypothetical protein